MLDFHEEAWNAFPNCKTVISCPYLGEKFSMIITSGHKMDRAETDNVRVTATSNS